MSDYWDRVRISQARSQEYAELLVEAMGDGWALGEKTEYASQVITRPYKDEWKYILYVSISGEGSPSVSIPSSYGRGTIFQGEWKDRWEKLEATRPRISKSMKMETVARKVLETYFPEYTYVMDEGYRIHCERERLKQERYELFQFIFPEGYLFEVDHDVHNHTDEIADGAHLQIKIYPQAFCQFSISDWSREGKLDPELIRNLTHVWVEWKEKHQ